MSVDRATFGTRPARTTRPPLVVREKERSGQMSDALVLALLVVGGLAFFFAAMTRFMGGLEE